MISLLKRLFGGAPARKDFTFLMVDHVEDVGENRWYRLNHWESPNYLKMNTSWDKDWKAFDREEPVVGVTYENRERTFLVMGDQPDFRVFLERDPNNPKDKNAIKVMGFATVRGTPTVSQLGFLSRETAEFLRDERELDARPYSVFLPYGERQYGLRVSVLVRSQAYKKRQGNVPPKY
ncbi:MAG: HIRAN domain-containing protein [Planctomycetota bacterium]